MLEAYGRAPKHAELWPDPDKLPHLLLKMGMSACTCAGERPYLHFLLSEERNLFYEEHAPKRLR